MLNRGKVVFKRIFSQPDGLVNQNSPPYFSTLPLTIKPIRIYEQNGPSNKLIKDGEKNRDKFDRLLNESHIVLLKLKSVFPFDFFPDEIIVDPMKVNIVSREFFLSPTTHTIYIKNILDILVDCSVFFATVRIMYEGFGPNVVYVKYLKKSEAQKARRIIQGLAVATREGVDFTKLNTRELVNKIENLGSATQASAP